MTPVELLISKLKGAKQTTGGWCACCPAHDDIKPSLSVSEGEDGRALVYCHAGCTVAAVCLAVGLSLCDLMPEHNDPKPAFGSARTAKVRRKVYATDAFAV